MQFILGIVHQFAPRILQRILAHHNLQFLLLNGLHHSQVLLLFISPVRGPQAGAEAGAGRHVPTAGTWGDAVLLDFSLIMRSLAVEITSQFPSFSKLMRIQVISFLHAKKVFTHE